MPFPDIEEPQVVRDVEGPDPVPEIEDPPDALLKRAELSAVWSSFSVGNNFTDLYYDSTPYWVDASKLTILDPDPTKGGNMSKVFSGNKMSALDGSNRDLNDSVSFNSISTNFNGSLNRRLPKPVRFIPQR